MATGRRSGRQVPADTIGFEDVTEFGTISGVGVSEDEKTIILTTENGEFPVGASRLVWLTTAG